MEEGRVTRLNFLSAKKFFGRFIDTRLNPRIMADDEPKKKGKPK
jgi:hypothetical protein